MHRGIARGAGISLITVLLTACGTVPAALPSSVEATPSPDQASPTNPTTVVYCSPGGVDQTMDIYQPPAGAARLQPAVMYVHGGGWSKGSSALGPSSGLVAQVVTGLLDRGFVVASINYRLAPAYHWPAQIDDTTCALRYLLAHAATYRIDPQRIGAFGGSAGGHLVSMLGTTQPGSVRAVADLWGPADLTVQPWPPAAEQAITTLLGTTPPAGSPLLAQASPVTFIAPNDPPFLIVHGMEDATVPVAQSQEFAGRLRAAGVPTTLILVENAGHGLRPAGNAPATPTQDQVLQSIVTFFTTNLS